MSLARLAANKVWDTIRFYYQRSVRKELAYWGIRQEDQFNEKDAIVQEAIELSPPEVRLGRYRRLKRAYDLALKNKYFIDYATPEQLNYDPFVQELWPMMERIKARDAEFAALNAHKRL